MRTPQKHVASDGTVTYKIRFRLNDRQTSETFDTKREATEFAKRLELDGAQAAIDWLLETEAGPVEIKPTLNEVAAEHIEHLTGIEEGTRKSYTRLWDRTWGPRIGHIQIHHLTKDHVRKAVNDLGRHYSHKSLQNQRGLLSGIVARAVEQGHLPTNVVKGIRLPRGQEGEAVEMRILTHAEYAKVVDGIKPHYRPLLDFLAGTGCRWGEAVALEVRDLQLDHTDLQGRPMPQVRFRRALKWSPDNQRIVGATKTKRSNRTVVLPAQIVPALRQRIAGKAKTDLVFTAPLGGQIHHRTFWSRVWHPAVKGLEPRPRIHDLRHTHASTLLGAGVPIHVVQARLGHESIQTTVDTYGHLLPDAQQSAANAAALTFAPSLSQLTA